MARETKGKQCVKGIAQTSLAVLLALAGFSCALRADQPPRAELVTGIQHAVSPPMREVVPAPPSPAAGMIPVRHPVPARPGTFRPDPVLQTNTTAATSSKTTTHSSIDGIAGDGYIPPDTNLAVGDTQMVEMVNVEYAVYDKVTGAQLQAPRAIHNVFAALGAPCGTADGGDPVVLYDHIAGRWLISQLEYNRPFNSNYECVAISTSSDATGSYNLYALAFGTNLPDYPKWGVWPDAYYLSANIFYRGSTFQGAAACALPRILMLSGQPISSNQVVCFQDPSEASLLPADLDGAALPASGEPEFFANFDSALKLYRFHYDFATPGNSTFTGPIGVSGATSFTEACGGGACVPQPGTNQELDSLGDRLMYRLSYRNFGGYESLLATHSVRVNSSGQTGIRWYEVRSPNGTPTAYQQGTYSPDTSTYRWMSSIAQDQNGDIAVGYSVSNGSSTSPGIRYAGRIPKDSLGTLEAETTVVDGSGYQSSYSRWGDYSSMSLDPSDDCTFWYTTEYKASSGSFNWNTYIASFKFSGCGSSTPPTTPTGLTATAGDAQVSLTWTASADATGYDVLRSTNGIDGTYTALTSGVASTSYTDSDVTNGTQYCYEVDASNANGTSDPSSPQCATPTLQAPAAPTGLAATAGDQQVNLSWLASSGADYYNVYRSETGSAGSYTNITPNGVVSTSYPDTGLTNQTTYYYYVTAENSAGESGPSNPVSAIPQASTTLDAPTNLTAKAAGKSGKINLSWTQSSSPNIVANKIYRDDGVVTTLNATTSYSDSNTSKGTSYCYDVTAVNSSGIESSHSTPSCATAGATAK
jgi:fibronectin type 3 domain-containing protein